jgi:hypothetical protein
MNNIEKKAMSEAFAAEFKDAWKSNEGRQALAEKITVFVNEQVVQKDLSTLIIDKDTFYTPQKPEYTKYSGLTAYWHEPGSYAPRTSVIRKTFTVTTDMLSVHPEYPVKQLKAGRYPDLVETMNLSVEAMLGQTNALIWNTIRTAVGTSGSNYSNIATPITAAALNAGIAWVNDKAGGVRCIVGRGSVLEPIDDFAVSKTGVYSDRQLDEIMRTGVVNIYKGAPIVSLPQYYDGHGIPTIAPKTILIVGNSIGKFVQEDDIEQMSEVDIDTVMWHQHLFGYFGCVIFNVQNVYRIDVYS